MMKAKFLQRSMIILVCAVAIVDAAQRGPVKAETKVAASLQEQEALASKIANDIFVALPAELQENIVLIAPWKLTKTVPMLPTQGVAKYSPQVAISEDGSVIAYAYKDQLHVISDYSQNDIPSEPHMADVRSLVLSRNGRRIIACNSQSQIKDVALVDKKWGIPVIKTLGLSIAGRPSQVSAVVSDDGNVLAYGCWGCRTIVIESPRGKQVVTLDGVFVPNSLAMDATGSTIAIGVYNNKRFPYIITRDEKGWNLSQKPVVELDTEGSYVMDGSGNYFAGCGKNLDVNIIYKKGDLWNEAESAVMPELVDQIFSKPTQLIMSAKGDIVYALPPGNNFIQIAIRSVTNAWYLGKAEFPAGLSTIAASGNGAMVAAASGEKLYMASWEKGRLSVMPNPIFTLSPNAGLISDLAMSADGSTIAVSSYGAKSGTMCVLTNPGIKYRKDLTAARENFLKDLERIGTKSIIRLNDDQFEILESMPWPRIEQILKTYLITWTADKKLVSKAKVEEQDRLNRYKARLEEKKKEWKAEQSEQKKAGEQKKEAQ